MSSAASTTICALATPIEVPPHAPACLTIKADPPNSPKQVGLHIQHTPGHITLYTCVYCLFDLIQSLRAEDYVNIRVLGGVYDTSADGLPQSY